MVIHTVVMIDSHAHVGEVQFAVDRPAVVKRARAAGVRWLEVGTTVATSQSALQVAADFPEDVVGVTVGVHPSEISQRLEWELIEALLDDPRVVAVGEVGLDYSRGGRKEQQLPALEHFVQLAVARHLPIVWHVRSSTAADAHRDMIAFLQGLPADQRPSGVMHTFSGTWEQAQEYLTLGMYLSLSGVATFKNAHALRQVAREMPLHRLLIETDCPYLTPDPYRGQRNEPAYVQYVARQVANLRGVSFEEIATTSEHNTMSLFGLKA